MIIVYFSVQEKQILSLYHDQMISDENVVSERQSHQLITHSNMSSLPDLDRLAIIHSHQDKLLRAEGDSRSLLALVWDDELLTIQQLVYLLYLTSQCVSNGWHDKLPPPAAVRVAGDRQMNRQTVRQCHYIKCTLCGGSLSLIINKILDYTWLRREIKPRHDAALPRAVSRAALPRARKAAAWPTASRGARCKPRALARKAASPRAAKPRHTDACTYLPRLI